MEEQNTYIRRMDEYNRVTTALALDFLFYSMFVLEKHYIFRIWLDRTECYLF